MIFQKVKKLSSEHKGLSIVTLAVLLLSILSILSILFWDQSIFQWQRQNLAHLETPLLVKGLTQLGKAWLLIWLLLCWALLTQSRQKALIGLTALFLLIFTVLPLKTIIHRPRPRDVIENNTQFNGFSGIFRSWSFPSGDTASAFAVAAAVFPFISWFGRSITFSLAGFVGIFRVVSFAHYLSDVFAGAAVGIIVAYLAYRLVISMSSLRRDLTKLLNPGILLAAIIIIPVVTGISSGMDDLLIFSMFYPPLAIVLYLLSKVNRPYLLSKTFRS